MTSNEKTLLKCSVCGENASVNTPGIDENGNIVCHVCLDKMRDGVLRCGIEQRSGEDGTLYPDSNCSRYYNGNTLRFYPNEEWSRKGYKKGFRYGIKHPYYKISAYTNDGAIFPLLEFEIINAICRPLSVLRMMDNTIEQGEFRCTDCHKLFRIEELGGRPLFAGKVCKPCWKKHLLSLKEEQKKGHVCSRCGEPYGNCCC